MPLSDRLFTRVQQEMRIRKYAPPTIKAYLSALRQYVRFLHPRLPRDAGPEDVKAFLLHSLDLGLGRSSLDQAISVLKFLYVGLYGRPMDGFDVKRPARSDQLPDVPTRAEVLRLADALNNRRHRLALLLLYAGGLRVSELVRARVADVDLEGLAIHVRSGKGSKGRITVLSEVIVDEVRAQCEGRQPQDPLIPSQNGGRWTTRSCERVLAQACLRAGVRKRVTPHSLRHAFATHLVERGTELAVVQGLLGHSRKRTTRRYVRLTNPATRSVRSPL